MRSYEGPIQHDSATGRPLNPAGRTGIEGRGLLGKWGPNHAADPIVTRVSPETGHLEVLLIQRRCGAWAIPGGMVDSGEDPLTTARRELHEETGVALDETPGTVIYQGLGDGPRTTDNAWIETTAVHFHAEATSSVAHAIPQAASDAIDSKWMTITPDLIRSLYANHGELLSMAIAQWPASRPSLSPEISLQLEGIDHIPLLTNLAGLSGRVGIFGGSFDPITAAHVAAAKKVAEAHDLDAVVFMPTGQNPLKAHHTIATARERVEMTYHALRNEPKLFVSPLEARAAEVRYTVDTLRSVRAQIDPERCKLFLIVGADCLRDIAQWKEYREIPQLAELLPIARTGESDLINDSALVSSLNDAYGESIATQLLDNLVEGLPHAASSTDARRALRNGMKSLLITTPVARFINERGLYRQ